MITKDPLATVVSSDVLFLRQEVIYWAVVKHLIVPMNNQPTKNAALVVLAKGGYDRVGQFDGLNRDQAWARAQNLESSWSPKGLRSAMAGDVIIETYSDGTNQAWLCCCTGWAPL